MAGFDDFWNRIDKGQVAGGMFDLGAGIYGRNAAQDEMAKRRSRVQGPLFNANMDAAQGQLARAGNFDPRAAGQEHFDAQQGLLKGLDQKTEADLLANLHGKGMLGISSYNPGVEGITPNGTAMNPHMAAYYAARNARDAKMAAGALDQGEAQLDRMLNRSGMLQQNAGRAQATGMAGEAMRPSRAAQNMEMLKGLGGTLKKSGMFDFGMDWLKKSFGGDSLGFDLGFGDYWN